MIVERKERICRFLKTNLVELDDIVCSLLFNDDGKTSLDDICGHGHVNVDGGELAIAGDEIAWCWCSGERRIDDGGDERRT